MSRGGIHKPYIRAGLSLEDIVARWLEYAGYLANGACCYEAKAKKCVERGWVAVTATAGYCPRHWSDARPVSFVGMGKMQCLLCKRWSYETMSFVPGRIATRLQYNDLEFQDAYKFLGHHNCIYDVLRYPNIEAMARAMTC